MVVLGEGQAEGTYGFRSPLCFLYWRKAKCEGFRKMHFEIEGDFKVQVPGACMLLAYLFACSDMARTCLELSRTTKVKTIIDYPRQIYLALENYKKISPDMLIMLGSCL